MSFTLSGVSAMTRKIKQVAEESISRAKDSLHDEGMTIMAESQEVVPVDTGHLKSTGRVSDPVVDNKEITVILSYDADYSAVVHESDVSDGRKFLEKPLRNASGKVIRRVGERLKL